MTLHVYRFEKEVNKWDDNRNDIVVLAKEMCMMMMDMSDFTRYTLSCMHRNIPSLTETV